MSNLALNSTAFDVTFGLQQLAARDATRRLHHFAPNSVQIFSPRISPSFVLSRIVFCRQLHPTHAVLCKIPNFEYPNRTFRQLIATENTVLHSVRCKRKHWIFFYFSFFNLRFVSSTCVRLAAQQLGITATKLNGTVKHKL